MTRVFSLASESLGYLVGYALLHADEVAICSPWLSDVELRFPLNDVLPERRMTLSEAIAARKTVDCHVFLREGESHNEYIQNRLADIAQVTVVPDLHAKAVVTDEFVYVGSANITHSGLLLNVELCELVENNYGSVSEYVERELELRV